MYTEEIRNSYKILITYPEEKSPLGRTRCRWNIIGCRLDSSEQGPLEGSCEHDDEVENFLTSSINSQAGFFSKK